MDAREEFEQAKEPESKESIPLDEKEAPKVPEPPKVVEAPKTPTVTDIKVAKAILDETPGFKRRMVKRKDESMSRYTKWWIGFAFCTIHTIGVILDLILVFVLEVRSITGRIREASEEHQAVLVAGVLASVGIGYLVRHWWWMVFYTGIMCGHFFAYN